MAEKSNVIPISPEIGRKKAYVARNRASLIRAAQQVFAEIGPTATIEAVATEAEVAASTVYKHFGTKEHLLSLAVLEAFSTWQEWALPQGAHHSDPLQQLVIPMRLLVRLKQTHPLYAQLVQSCFTEIPASTEQLTIAFKDHMQFLHQEKILVIDNFEIRNSNFEACLLALLGKQTSINAMTDEEADTSIEIALGMLGISAAKAKKLAHSPLDAMLHQGLLG
jgi:AcrR family transcriptional regulator